MPEQSVVNVTPDQLMQVAFNLPSDRKLYFNGATAAIGPGDCAIVLLHNIQPVAYLNASHATIKSLAAQLNRLIEDFEAKSGLHIPTLEETQALFEKRDSE